MTTQADIREWLERGKTMGATHLIVVCDTFDWEDYPVFVRAHEDVHEKMQAYQGKSMQRVMEVYNLNKPWEPQLAKTRNFSY